MCTLAHCGVGGAQTKTSDVFVTIQPTSAALYLGQTQQFQASVTGTSNTAVTWSVNGTTGGSSATGTISSAGLYTAPGILPQPASVTITAASVADQSAAASAALTLQDNIVITVSPPSATLQPNAAQVFTASISGTGNPSTALNWSVNGIAGGNSSVGTIAVNGATSAIYTAPTVAPSPPNLTVTATSEADPSKSGGATVTISCTPSGALSPQSASLALGQTQTFAASLCIATGAAITWDVNGITGGNSAVGTITASGADAALYTAPADLPATNPVTIHAAANSANGGGTATASATATITSSVSVSILPATTTLAVGQIAPFAAAVQGSSDASVTWAVNGIPSGNGIVGEICANASNPCVPPSGPISGTVQYFAPALLPATNPVTLTAASHADPTKSATAIVILTGSNGPVSVAIAPGFIFLPPSTGTLSTAQFVANVSGSSNTGVIWTVQSAASGQGCAGAACGSVSSSGLYTAPTSAASPNAIAVTATSVADSTKSASATVVLNSGPAIEKI
ncbi:MAG TPA: hypothetical protein VJR23_03255, partial [Candidatus Acidoferrales bacterium]|nr:hypothetical protein [Candidatus Acidoferrales bacterium]